MTRNLSIQQFTAQEAAENPHLFSMTVTVPCEGFPDIICRVVDHTRTTIKVAQIGTTGNTPDTGFSISKITGIVMNRSGVGTPVFTLEVDTIKL